MLLGPCLVRLAAGAAIILPVLAVPQGLLGFLGQLLGLVPVLSSPPPSSLMTRNPSPACKSVNQGTLLCCESTFDGDLPLIVYFASQTAFKLNKNSINCIYGML